jgi:hypothetical protein
MSRSPTSRSSDAIQLTPKQANIYSWGWQQEARFRDAVCGRRFGKTFLGAKEMRRAAKLAARWNVSPDDEIWYAAPTFKQAKRVFWRRLKRAIPKAWMDGRPNESECYILLKTGHIIRIVGLDAYDNLRGSGLFFVLVDEWADTIFEAWKEVLRPMLSTCKYTIDGIEYVGGHALRIGTPKGFTRHCKAATSRRKKLTPLAATSMRARFGRNTRLVSRITLAASITTSAGVRTCARVR